MHNFTAVTDVCSQLTILHFFKNTTSPSPLSFTYSWKYGWQSVLQCWETSNLFSGS